MEKAILIIDKPKNCLECPIGENKSNILETYVICRPVRKGASAEVAKTIPDWCPLKPLPERKVVTANDATASVAIKYGWNNCLDAILKEEK